MVAVEWGSAVFLTGLVRFRAPLSREMLKCPKVSEQLHEGTEQWEVRHVLVDSFVDELKIT